jgi:hypothetical protein
MQYMQCMECTEYIGEIDNKRGTDTAPLLHNLQQCMTITR